MKEIGLIEFLITAIVPPVFFITYFMEVWFYTASRTPFPRWLTIYGYVGLAITTIAAINVCRWIFF